jgi:hypothetical protein
MSARAGGVRMWELLEDYERGILEPAPVRLGEMPAHARPRHRAIAADIALFIGLARADGSPHEAVPYSLGLAVQRGHVENSRQASDALKWLMANGVIAGAGALKPLPGRRYGTRLYRPPTGASGEVVPIRGAARNAPVAECQEASA